MGFIEQVVKKLREEQETIKTSLVERPVDNVGDYKLLVGRVKGLARAEEILSSALNEREEKMDALT